MKEQHRYQITTFVLLAGLTLSAFSPLRLWIQYHPWLSGSGWLMAAGFLGFAIRQIHVPGRLAFRSTVLGYGVSAAVIFLALGFLLGVLLKKLALSPYDHSFHGIWYNLMTVFPVLLVREMTRAYVTGVIWRTEKHRKFWLILFTVYMAVMEVNVSKFGKVQGTEALFIYVVKDVIPLFTRNILLAVLVFYGGTAAGVACVGLIQGFQRFFPFLPELPWIAECAIGIAFPVLYAMFVQDHCRRNQGARMNGEDQQSAGYLVALGACVAFSWFCVGVFPVYPSVILTGSMEPGIMPGDVVLIQKLKEEKDVYQIKEGTVLNFHREDITITHRVVQVLYDEAGNVSFQTKGDNNPSADTEIVEPDDITGTVNQVIPRVGIPVLVMRSGAEIPEGVVENGAERAERAERADGEGR